MARFHYRGEWSSRKRWRSIIRQALRSPQPTKGQVQTPIPLDQTGQRSDCWSAPKLVVGRISFSLLYRTDIETLQSSGRTPVAERYLSEGNNI